MIAEGAQNQRLRRGAWAESLILTASLCVVGGAVASLAQTPAANPEAAIEAPKVSMGDSLEELGNIHDVEDDPVLQQLWILGRYHGQYHWSEGSNGEDEGFESRRLRLGIQVKMFHKLMLHAQAVSGTDLEPFYNGFTELWAQWAFDPALILTVGQQKHRFTHDRNVSSRYINYLERSMLTNMFRADYTPAVTLSGTVDKITYYAGVFTNQTDRDIWDAFTEINSGYSLLGAVYYDLGDALGTDTAHLHFTALHSEANERATNLDRFNQGVSSALILTSGAASLVTEVTGGIGGERGDAVGLNVQPAVFLTEELQLAFRYQLAGSNEPTGLQAQRRYESPAGLPTGDLYQAGYAGLNYYLAKHRCKVMTGVEYATLGGEDVWTASTMFRFYFGPHSGGPFPMNQILRGHGVSDFLTHD